MATLSPLLWHRPPAMPAAVHQGLQRPWTGATGGTRSLCLLLFLRGSWQTEEEEEEEIPGGLWQEAKAWGGRQQVSWCHAGEHPLQHRGNTGYFKHIYAIYSLFFSRRITQSESKCTRVTADTPISTCSQSEPAEQPGKNLPANCLCLGQGRFIFRHQQTLSSLEQLGWR